MQTVSPRAGFLSNYEVLSILTAQRVARQEQIKTLSDTKKARLATLSRRPYPKEQEDHETDRIQPQDLHTVTFECIKYLEEEVHPIRRQTAESIRQLLDELEKLDLTKAERLQIVNLAPANLVQLVVCVDDFEERFPEEADRDHIISLVKSHLVDTAAPSILPPRHVERKAVNGDSHMQVDEEEEEYGGPESDEEFVNEGLGGAGEAQVAELDEVQD